MGRRVNAGCLRVHANRQDGTEDASPADVPTDDEQRNQANRWASTQRAVRCDQREPAPSFQRAEDAGWCGGWQPQIPRSGMGGCSGGWGGGAVKKSSRFSGSRCKYRGVHP
jgi:hypothetical protein